MRWRERLVVAALVLGVLSCGDNVPGVLGEPRSGSRLKLLVHVYDDGTRQLDPSALHDSERAEPCTPLPWSDGRTRCTPAAGEAVFADPECTQPVGRYRADELAPAYFVRPYTLAGERSASRIYEAGELPLALVAFSECAVAARHAVDRSGAIYEIGAPFTGTAYHLTTGDRCLPTSPLGFVLHEATAMSLDRFAASTLEVHESPDDAPTTRR